MPANQSPLPSRMRCSWPMSVEGMLTWTQASQNKLARCLRLPVWLSLTPGAPGAVRVLTLLPLLPCASRAHRCNDRLVSSRQTNHPTAAAAQTTGGHSTGAGRRRRQLRCALPRSCRRSGTLQQPVLCIVQLFSTAVCWLPCQMLQSWQFCS